MEDLAGWLRSLGLERYEASFLENTIDIDVLPELTEEDLEKLGIPLGDRKRLLKAIRSIPAGSQSKSVASGAASSVQGGQTRAAATERRHLSVMICDLVNSTALSARLDPEDMSAVMDAYHATCSRICKKYDGFLMEFRGDGMLACFGYPRAHEDDAERSVRAGLEIIKSLASVETPAAESLAVRIGIATGVVVIGDLSPEGSLREHMVVGDSTNLAARIQTLTEPGTVVVAASTRRLLGDLFHLRALGCQEVKGFAEPVVAWTVEGVSASATRFEASRVASLTDFIGRANEVDFLLKRQRLAFKGEGQIVLMSGEPGIGKSRLAAALAERIAGEPHTRLTFQCSPYHTNSALHPFIAQLERAAGFKEDDTPQQRADKLETALAADPQRLQATAPLFAALLSLPLNERYALLVLSPAEQRRRTLEALLDRIEGLARETPILLLFEDAHWADATSLELLDLMVARVRRLPILALFTFRPEFEPPWASLPGVSALALSRLEPGDVESMATRVTGGRVLPDEVMRGIVAKTDGNPLFVEELTKAVLESGILVEDANGHWLDGPLPPLAIPATLQDSLMARLDRLAPMKEVAQIAAVIGREFSYSLLRAVAGREETTLREALTQLERAELVFRHGEPPEAAYTFKHALVRDAAYESLLRRSRRQLHLQIACAIEERFAGIAANAPEIVAHHFTEAGLVDAAVEYWLKAGKLALGRSANAEALKHLRRGIELIGSLGPSSKHARKELDFYLALGPAMAATEGYATAGTLKVFSHTRKLLGDHGTPTEQMTVLWGAFLAHNMRAEHNDSLQVARQCLALAERHEHPGMLALANRFMGQTLGMMGSFSDARRHLDRTIELCTANEETIVAYRRFGIDDRAAAMFNLARVLLLLGYPDQSAAEAKRAVARAEQLGMPFTIAEALSHEALIGVLRDDMQWPAADVDRAITYSVSHGLLDPQHKAQFVKGSLLVKAGDQGNGLDLMRTAMTAQSQAVQGRHPLYSPLYLGHVANAHSSLAEYDIGLDILNEAIATAETSNERFFEAELYRLRGQVLATLNKNAEAEVQLRRALTIARQQQAYWWQLRAGTSLARLLREDGRAPEAYSLLQPIYGWFAEGFETTVLKDAKALLAELGSLSGQQAQA